MASVFWDAHGILFIDYLEKGKTINSDYYMSLLDRLMRDLFNVRCYSIVNNNKIKATKEVYASAFAKTLN